MKYIYHNCVVFLLMAALCSCEQKVVNPQTESTPSEWEALNIDDYEIDQRVNCFCATPPANRFHKITVRDDKIVSAVDLQDGQVLPEKDFAFFKTISELVEFVDSIDRDRVAVYDVRNDSTHGFPTFIYIDFDSRLADEEIGYVTKNLHPL
ncbi:MAG: DUF6174 domain-containing protein [Calditrichaeota bacterium]|nr:DUF6174 domain-containing protein [Calditrichota bacterium]